MLSLFITFFKVNLQKSLDHHQCQLSYNMTEDIIILYGKHMPVTEENHSISLGHIYQLLCDLCDNRETFKLSGNRKRYLEILRSESMRLKASFHDTDYIVTFPSLGISGLFRKLVFGMKVISNSTI